MRPKRLELVAAAGAAVWTVMYRLGQTWDSTSEERRRYLPVDSLVEDVPLVTNHTITIQARSMRCGPGSFKSDGTEAAGTRIDRWIVCCSLGTLPAPTRPWPSDRPSVSATASPMAPPSRAVSSQVEEPSPNKYLVLRSWTHLPPNLRKDPRTRMEWTWGFYHEEADDNATRLIFRVRGSPNPAWNRLAFHLLVVPADFIMGRSMCLGLKGRVEHLHHADAVNEAEGSPG